MAKRWFPQIDHSTTESVVIKSRKWSNYVAIIEHNGKPKLTAKTIQSLEDSDIYFKFYFYTTAEPTESKLVLPMHEKTGHYLSMTEDKRLVLKLKDDVELNTVDGIEDLEKLTEANERFFYIRHSGLGEDDYVLEAMNGKTYNHYLSLRGEMNPPELLAHGRESRADMPGQYPEETIFSIVNKEKLSKAL